MSWRTAEAAYLVEIAKDWTVSCIASADTSSFLLIPHRFELSGGRVRRHRLEPESLEAISPLDADLRSARPTAWAHGTVVTLLIDSGSMTTAVEQEVVEILAVDGRVVLAQAAAVIRIPGLPPCIGAFGTPA